MRSIKAIFIKQAKDVFKNPQVLLLFILFPVMAFILTEFVAKPSPELPPTIFVTQMASMFAGMSLIMSMTNVIAEDIERKSLRFLVMAGVKPHEYLLGTAGFNLLAGIIVSGLFALIGGFTGMELVKFFVAMTLGVIASVMLGATLGIVSKNQQSATSISLPVVLILSFVPMIAQFNESAQSVAAALYTQQVTMVISDASSSFINALLVIGANILVFVALFAVVYKKKGMRLG